MCGNIKEITLVFEIVYDCGCVQIKYMYLFHYINEPVDHKVDITKPQEKKAVFLSGVNCKTKKEVR